MRGVDLQRELRVPLVPAADARQQPAVRERRQHRHAQPRRVARRGGGRRLHAVVELRQRGLHAAQQRLAGGVEHHATPAPIEQREAQLLLEHRASAG